jgi:fructose-1,6-bisphosphatase/inositol monophosphatase family enzyme
LFLVPFRHPGRRRAEWTVRLFSVRQAEEIDLLIRAAGRCEIMPRFRRLGAGAVREKSGPLDLVTDADDAAEAMIAHGLARMFPGCLVVGEEAASADPSLLDKLADADLAFTIDPIDGTANYAAGLPLFGTMVAAVMRGEVVAGVIHDPVIDSSYLTVRGEGAWEHAADGTRAALRAASPAPLGEMTGAASWRYLPPKLREVVLPNLGKLAQIWDFRCAAHEHRMNASGHCHFLMFNRLMPWDHLAGVLMHQEAGGYSARFDGSLYRPGMTSGGLICAPSSACFQMLQEALLK